MVLTSIRCLRGAAGLLQGARLVAAQTADPEPEHHGRRLDVRQLPLLAPDPVGATQGAGLVGWQGHQWCDRGQREAGQGQ